MMRGMVAVYSTREVSRLVKLPEHRIRACARAGLVGRPAAKRRPLSFEFRDLLVLRTVSQLLASGVSFARVQRALLALRRRLPADLPLSVAQVRLENGEIVASDGERTWQAESGQYELPLGDVAAEPSEPAPLYDGIQPSPAPPAISLLDPAGDLQSANAWFDLAIRLEDEEPQRAYEAYLRTLACDPEHVEATINIGRLCSAAGELHRAAAYFRQAVRIEPSQPIAHFNLGVTLHDLGDVHSAIVSYRTALLHDPHFADAHYNLATLLEQQGDAQGALRHMNAYRVACQEPEP